MDIVDLDARRAAKLPNVGRCECGGEWFALRRRSTDTDAIPENGTVALRANGSVRAYAGEPVCLDCDTPWTPAEGWPYN